MFLSARPRHANSNASLDWGPRSLPCGFSYFPRRANAFRKQKETYFQVKHCIICFFLLILSMTLLFSPSPHWCSQELKTNLKELVSFLFICNFSSLRTQKDKRGALTRNDLFLSILGVIILFTVFHGFFSFSPCFSHFLSFYFWDLFIFTSWASGTISCFNLPIIQ